MIYPPLSAYEGVSIKRLFEMLLMTTGCSPVDLRAFLNDRLRKPDVGTEPPLPRVWQIVPVADGGIMIETAKSLIDPATVIIHTRRMVPATASIAPDGTITIKPPAPPVAAAKSGQESIAKPAASQPVEPVVGAASEPASAPATSSAASSPAEPVASSPPSELDVEKTHEQMTIWLAGKLKLDPNAKRDRYLAECREEFGVKVTRDLYRIVILPAARVRAGLPRKSSPGLKSRKTNSPDD
jgi:hypothetical protein